MSKLTEKVALVTGGSRGLNAPAERRSQFRRTPLMPAPSKPRSKRPWRHLAGSMCL